MFGTNLITTTQTLNPVLAINSVAFKMLSNEKGFLSVEPRDYFTHTPRYPSQRTDRKKSHPKGCPTPAWIFS